MTPIVTTRDINVREDGQRKLTPVTMKNIVEKKLKDAFSEAGLSEKEFNEISEKYTNLDVMEYAIKKGDEGPELQDAILEPWRRKSVDKKIRTPIITTQAMPDVADIEEKQKRDQLRVERDKLRAKEAEKAEKQVRMEKARMAKKAKKEAKTE